VTNPLQQSRQAGVRGRILSENEARPVPARFELAALPHPAASFSQRLPEPLRPRRADSLTSRSIQTTLTNPACLQSWRSRRACGAGPAPKGRVTTCCDRAHRSSEHGSTRAHLLLITCRPVAVEAVKQFGPPALGQTAKRLRMSDGAIREDLPDVLSTLPAGGVSRRRVSRSVGNATRHARAVADHSEDASACADGLIDRRRGFGRGGDDVRGLPSCRAFAA
jgi:hypothetical protein